MTDDSNGNVLELWMLIFFYERGQSLESLTRDKANMQSK